MSSDHRLPSHVVPQHYRLFIDASELEKFRFRGTVQIDVDVSGADATRRSICVSLVDSNSDERDSTECGRTEHRQNRISHDGGDRRNDRHRRRLGTGHHSISRHVRSDLFVSSKIDFLLSSSARSRAVVHRVRRNDHRSAARILSNQGPESDRRLYPIRSKFLLEAEGPIDASSFV